MKTCIICGATEVSHWYAGPLCKKCYMAQWRANNKEHIYKTNRSPKARFCNAKKSALERGKEWLLSLEEFIFLSNQPCSYCSNELGPLENYGGGLDRIDNSIGYMKTNVIPCCKICNLIRNIYLSVEETKIAVQAIIAYRKSRVAL